MEDLDRIVTAIQYRLQGTPLADFYAQRQRLNGGKKWSGPLLLIRRDDGQPLRGYAYHKGGREEMQFNAGFEDDGKYFRYGVAFSLEPGQDLPDPVAALLPKILLFNRLIKRFPSLHNLSMWVNDGQKSYPLMMGKIDSRWLRNGLFIFLGERSPTSRRGVHRLVPERAAEVLNMLWPLYRAIESEHVKAYPAGNYKVARLCWNTNFWHSPTGREGKLTKDSFEADYGFGYEEWLFDRSMLIDDWKYGFVHAFSRSRERDAGRRLGLLLYTINHDNKQRYWVGVIDDLEVLGLQESYKVSLTYRRLGWLGSMCEQVKDQGLKASTLMHAKDLVNVRYRPESLRLFDRPIPFSSEDLRSSRYSQLQTVPLSQSVVLESRGEVSRLTKRNVGKTTATRNVTGGSCEVELIQKQWQHSLVRTLEEDVDGSTADLEWNIDGYSVDIVWTVKERPIFIELKTFGSVRQIIRAALAQLMEYAYWPSERRSETLLIVGPADAGADDDEYLATLRERFGIPVFYLPYRNGRIAGVADWVKTLPAQRRNSRQKRAR